MVSTCDVVHAIAGHKSARPHVHGQWSQDSLKRLFLKDGEEGFVGCSSNATLEVLPSKVGCCCVCCVYHLIW